MRVLARVLAAVLMATVLLHVSPVAAATKPSAPRAVKATPLNKAVKVSWTAPASNGGSRIDAYAVQRRNTTSSPWVTVKYTGAAARTWTETGLVNGARFYYRVMARNALGWGSASAQVSAVPRTVPSAVPYFEADNYDSALGAYWGTTPNNGAAIDSYRVEISLDGATWSVGASTPTIGTKAAPFLFPGLTPGTRYWMRIRAHNAAGYGPPSGIGPYRAYTVPHPVTGLVATAGDEQVSLDWDAPTTDIAGGRPPAVSYLVERSDDDGATWTSAGTPTGTAWVADGLANGVAYLFRVKARSGFAGIGDSTGVTTGPVTPNGTTLPPSAPQDLDLGWDVDTLRLTWAAPADDGGRALHHYEADWSGATPTASYAADATSAAVGDEALTESVRLRACNSPTVCGAWTDAVGPITGPVRDLAATEQVGETRTIAVAWDAPANGAADSYDVLRKVTGEDTFALLASTDQTSYVDATAAPLTDYTYRVVPHRGGTGQPQEDSLTTGPAQALTASPSGIGMTEGQSAVFTVTLAAAVTAPTEVTVTSSDPDAAAPVTTPVTVPAGQASVQVTVAAPQDADTHGESVTLTAQLGGLSDTVTATVVDDDEVGITVSKTSLVVPNGETDSTVEVTLSAQPAGDVEVTATASTSPQERVSVPAGPLVFTPENWDVPQALAITRTKAGTTSVTLTSPGLTSRVITVN